jgi:hypothetical protein
MTINFTRTLLCEVYSKSGKMLKAMLLHLASELHMRRMARRCEAVVAAAWCKRGRVTALF